MSNKETPNTEKSMNIPNESNNTSDPNGKRVSLRQLNMIPLKRDHSRSLDITKYGMDFGTKVKRSAFGDHVI